MNKKRDLILITGSSGHIGTARRDRHVDRQDVLVLCPTHRDLREIEWLGGRLPYRFHYHDYASLALEALAAQGPTPAAIREPRIEVASLLEKYGGTGIAAVASTDDYPGTTLASIVAKSFGLPGVQPAVNLLCQHKYHCRLAQRRIVPAAVPGFELVDPARPAVRALIYPLFLKPVKSFFSIGAQLIASSSELHEMAGRSRLPHSFFRPFESLLELCAPQYLHGVRSILAEKAVCGWQATVEGYIAAGEFHLLGITDSVFYPGTICFQRFEYPSRLPARVQSRMQAIAAEAMHGIGYDQGMFNIEMVYDAAADDIHIIEINPRMASQFADLYEKVDGINSYEVLFDLALGREPDKRMRQGHHRVAASCVLRKFEDALVQATPSGAEIERVRARHPDIRIEVLASVGRRLSEEMQDGCSYRYAILNLGGNSRGEILASLQECLATLTFRFQPAVPATAGSEHIALPLRL